MKKQPPPLSAAPHDTPPPEKRLGWFQISLLTILWTRDMYGLELQTYLKLQGNDVSVGQIYPALKHLEDDGLVSSYEEIRKGANRKYYSLTPTGRQSILQFVEMFKSIFNGIIWQKLSFLPDKLLDLSLTYPELILRSFAPKVGPTGHYFLLSENPTQTQQLELLLDYINLNCPFHILEPFVASDSSSPWSIPLPDRTLDLIYSIFRIPKKLSPAIFTEVARLLKPDGHWIILDMISVGDHIIQDMEMTLRTSQHLSFESADFLSLLSSNNLKIAHQTIFRGLAFLTVIRK
jgi:PadR family transcriptional regulator PadR